jgi:nicotinamidase-related amidase
MSDKQCLLTPGESVVALIDYQPQMFFGVGSHERHMVLNNAVALAKAARLFGVPVVLTTVAAQTFSGARRRRSRRSSRTRVPIDRTTMNSWEDKNFRAAVTGFGPQDHQPACGRGVCVCFPSVYAIAKATTCTFRPTLAATSRSRRTSAPSSAPSRPASYR